MIGATISITQAGAVFLCRIERLQGEAPLSERAGQVVERNLAAGALGVLEADGGNADEGEVALAIAKSADRALTKPYSPGEGRPISGSAKVGRRCHRAGEI